MRAVTARGFRDVLPQEAVEREALAASIVRVFDSWGYAPVETPVIEEYSVLEAASGGPEGSTFRLFDLDGSLLALRPEMTVPVARLAASRLLDDAVAPLRLRYAGPVFHEQASLRGQARQFTQIGVELLGAGGAAADAEIVSLAVESLLAAGLAEHTVAIGSVEVLAAILEASGMPEEFRRLVLDAAHARDLVGIARLARIAGVPDRAARALAAVPRLRGGLEAIERCRQLVEGFGCDEALAGLESVWSVLDALGLREYLVIDFGVMREFDYYTGLVLEAYAPGIGAAVGGGGRYDNALAAYGASAPAAGFALGLERVHIAAAEQENPCARRAADDVVGGAAAVAFAAAAALRRDGRRVVLAADESPELIADLAASLRARPLVAEPGALIALAEDGSVAERLDWPGHEASTRGGEVR